MLEQNAMIPLYQQLMQEIKSDISKQVYKPGDKLPTEKDLEAIYRVSRITVRRAVKELCDQKILAKKQGKGTFVLNTEIQPHLDGIGGFHDVIENQQAGGTQEVLSIREIPATPEMAGYLQIKPEEEIVVIRRVLKVDSGPMMLDTCYVPSSRFSGITEYLKGNFSVYRIFRQNYGVKMNAAEKVIKVRKASKEEQELLKCPEGDPVFELFKIVFDENNLPVHVSISIVKGENTSYIISTDNQNRLKIKRPGQKKPHLISQP